MLRLQVASIVVVAAVVVTACSPEAQAGPRVHILSGELKLLTPAKNAVLPQNQSDIGCPAHATRGYGFRLHFDWEDVEGADHYTVYLKHTGSQYAAVDRAAGESEFAQTWCNGFVADFNLDNWTWRVAAFAPGDSTTPPDTLWSEERQYRFEPCRLADSLPCYAPAP